MLLEVQVMSPLDSESDRLVYVSEDVNSLSMSIQYLLSCGSHSEPARYPLAYH